MKQPLRREAIANSDDPDDGADEPGVLALTDRQGGQRFALRLQVRAVRTQTSIPIEITTSKVAKNQNNRDSPKATVAELRSIVAPKKMPSGTLAEGHQPLRHRTLAWVTTTVARELKSELSYPVRPHGWSVD